MTVRWSPLGVPLHLVSQTAHPRVAREENTLKGQRRPTSSHGNSTLKIEFHKRTVRHHQTGFSNPVMASNSLEFLNLAPSLSQKPKNALESPEVKIFPRDRGFQPQDSTFPFPCILSCLGWGWGVRTSLKRMNTLNISQTTRPEVEMLQRTENITSNKNVLL